MPVAPVSSPRPVIGVAPRVRTHLPTLEVPEPLAPEWTVASVFDDAIVAAGGLPVVLPLTEDEGVIDECVARCDGFALPGGVDVDPALWGDEGYDRTPVCPRRDAYELALVRRVLAADKPLFATCRGAQLLNVALGGTLCMDVPSLGASAGMVQWRHEMILTSAAHPVKIDEGTLLCALLGGRTQVQVNSSHHCCVDRLGDGVVLTARATDGVPEAIEVPAQRFCVGVQWHPEYLWSQLDEELGLWRGFVDACR